jgi:hypothetical protein
MSLFAPRLPAEIERAERERVARKKPHLALVPAIKPEPDFYVWHSVSDLIPIGNRDE